MLNFEIHQMDVKSTFLHDELKEGIYMVQLERYKELDRRYFICKHQRPYINLDKHLECGMKGSMIFLSKRALNNANLIEVFMS
jgi:hypothetical protein